LGAARGVGWLGSYEASAFPHSGACNVMVPLLLSGLGGLGLWGRRR
jgi:hypothetical protein